MATEKSEADVPDAAEETSGARRPRSTSLKAVAALLVMLLPLAVGAGYLWGSNADIAATWGSAEGEQVAAPGAGGMNVDVNQIQDARRATGAAGTEAGFAKIGSGAAKDGAVELEKGAKTAKDGAKELSDGLTLLQNGTGELGTGAKNVSDGVNTMVDGLTGLVAAQTAVLGAIDEADKALKDSNDPRAPQLRKDLAGVKKQITTQGIDANAVDQANKLKSGAKELASQLNDPGAPYHDGIYSAAKGAKELSTGMAELHTGTKELRDGLVTVDRQVTNTDQKIAEAKRALPVPTANQIDAANGGAASGDADADTGAVAALAPTIAVLVAALAMFGAALLWSSDWLRGLFRDALSWPRRVVVAGAVTAVVAAVASVALFAVAEGFTWQRGLAGVGVVVLAALAAGLMTAASQRIFGRTTGRYVVAIGSILQVGIVGVVWRTSMATDIPEAAQAAAALMPLHYPTMALTSIGNATSGPLVWIGVGVLAVLAVISEAVLVMFGRPENEE